MKNNILFTFLRTNNNNDIVYLHNVAIPISQLHIFNGNYNFLLAGNLNWN